MSSARGAALGQHELPDPLAVLGLGEREVDDEVEAAQERVVDVLAEVRREDDRARVALHLLQQVGDLDVGVAVVRVARPRSACRTARRPRRRRGSRSSPRRRRRRGRGSSRSPRCTSRRRWRGRRGRARGRGRAASTWPAIVLPVPDSPANSTFSPWRPRDGLLVAPVGEHEVAVAQVGRDRVQHLELALGRSRGPSQLEAGRRAATASSPSRVLEALARAEVEVRRRSARRSPRAVAASRATSAASTICADREPELGGDVVASSVPVRAAHAGAPLGEARRCGASTTTAVALAERERPPARVGARRRACARGARSSTRSSAAGARPGSSSSRPSKQHAAGPRAARSTRGLGASRRVASTSRDVARATSGRPSAVASSDVGVGPGDHHAAAGCRRASSGAQLVDRRRAPGVVLGDRRRAAAGRRLRGLVDAPRRAGRRRAGRRP